MTQNWEKLLKGIVEHQAETNSENWDRFYDNGKIYEITGLNVGEIEPARKFLEKRSLIEMSENDNGTRNVIITKEGFRTAREQRFRRNENFGSKSLVLFTMALAISATSDLLINFADNSIPDDKLVVIGFVIILLFISLLVIVHKDGRFNDL